MSQYDPPLFTRTGIGAIALSAANIIIAVRFGIGDAFVWAWDHLGMIPTLFWLSVSALCALVTFMTVVLIVLKALILGLDLILGKEGSVVDPNRGAMP